MTRKKSSSSAKTARAPHASTRRRAGRPARQRHTHSRTQQSTRRWSHDVMAHSDALDLEGGIFKSGNAEEIAQSLKHASLTSKRRRGTPYQSAMSMLNFYINRAGKNLPKTRRQVLETTKGKLRAAFGRTR